MNIRRFVAADMRAALAAIRAELGADAVMLSNRKLPDGVEVIAAMDYDDSLLAAAGEHGETPGAPSAIDTGRALASDESADDPFGGDYDDEDVTYRPVPGNAARRSSDNPLDALLRAEDEDENEEHEQAPHEPVGTETSAMAEEIKDLRRLLETQLASLAWNDLNRQAPVRARLLRELAKLGVDAELAAQLVDEIPPSLSSREGLRALVRLFGERLPLVPWDIADRGGTFAVVGPTGVGKTTTIAKIAARFVLRHSVEELGLVSTDTYRIGARQQLFNFARILRSPMHVAESSTELRRVLDRFANKKLVLIDTAGMSQRDVRLANQFATLKVEGHHVQTLLALSAGADRRCLAEALSVFSSASPEALIITKLDEAAALGGVLSLAIRANLPVAYISDGQRVPEDLHLAAPKRFWLLHNAVKLTLDPAFSPNETELAHSYGHLELAANA